MRDKTADFRSFHTFGVAFLAFHADRLSLPAPDADGSRTALFRESAFGTLERYALGTAWALAPSRIRGVPGLARMLLEELMAADYALPDPESALAAPAGLAGVVHDLSLPTMLAAYRRGLYPWAHIGPLKWWSPPARSVLFFRDAHISDNQRKLMRSGRYSVTFDRAFDRVIAACAGKRSGRWHLTWITPRVMRAYAEAFDAGYAHSFEVWNEAGELVAGGYGLAIGAAFFSESQFTHETNAGKIGMAALNFHLARWNYHFNDGKLIGPLWKTLGWREIPRREFLARLSDAVVAPGRSGRWQIEADPSQVSRWKPVEINHT